jgi:hypothetical protein
MLDMAVGSSIFAGGMPSAAVPMQAGASPQGPRTVSQKAWGITAGGGDGGPATPGLGTCLIAAGSLAALVFIWWSLPK